MSGARAITADPHKNGRAPCDEAKFGGRGPLITIAIPTFNRGEMLRKTIQCVLNQEYANFELIVSDNASSDQTQEVIASFTDNRIRSLRQTANIGAYRNVNACIESARGAYILILPDDDAIAPNALQLYVDFLGANPDLSIVMGAVEYLNESRQPPTRRYEEPPIATGCYDGLFLLKEYLRRRLSFELCTVLFRTDVLRAVGGFATNDYAGDLATFSRFLLRGRCGYVAAPCGLYLIGPHSESARLGTEFRLRDVSSVLQELTAAASGLGTKARRQIRYLAAYHLALLALDHAADIRRRGGSVAQSIRFLSRFKWCFRNGLVAFSALRSRSTVRILLPTRMEAFARSLERPRWRADVEIIHLNGPQSN